MGNKVYVTYSNYIRTNVTGVYANKELAKKHQNNYGFLDTIDSFELQGYKQDLFNDSLNEDCKYYDPRIAAIRIMISALYDIEGCHCGGLAHVVVDDDNFTDEIIDWEIEYCNKEENKDCVEKELVITIIKELKKLSIEQRALLFSSFYSFRCDSDCSNCLIDKGKKMEFE